MKKKPRKYFSGGDIASILPMVADLAGNYINAATYEFDPKGPAYKADWTKGISQGVVGVIPELIKQQKDSKKRSAYVASATPGSYQQGGPIQPTPRPVSRGVRPQGYSVYTDIPVVTPQRPVVDPFNPFPVVQPPTILPVRIPSGGSSKSKSKDRYREMETGGPIEPNLKFLGRSQNPEFLNLVKSRTSGGYPKTGVNTDKWNTLKTFDNGDSLVSYSTSWREGSTDQIGTGVSHAIRDAKTGKYFPVDSYAHVQELQKMETGGQLDTQLSNTSFQVKGNPNITDGNHYPELNANLDHNEVVKDNFVYSTKLKTPAGKPFSFEAAKLEKSTGKAQKVLLSNPNDSTAKNTMMMNEASMKSLAKLQETMATSMGLREGRERSFANGGFYDNGGPGDPPYTFVGLTSNKEFPVANLTGKEWLDFTNPYDPAKGTRRRPVTPDTFTGVKLAPNQAAIDLGRDGMYYNPYDRTFSVRNSRGEYVSVTPNPGQFDVSGDNIKDLVGNKTYNVAEHLRFMQSPKLENAGPSGPSLETPSNVLTNPSETIEELGAFPYPVVSPSPTPAPPVTETQKRRRPGGDVKPSVPTKTAPFNTNAAEYDRAVYEEMQVAANRDLPLRRDAASTSIVPPTSTAAPRPLPNITAPIPNTGGTGTDLAGLFSGRAQDFTVGDGLQALTVLSKFGQLQGGAEVERPYYDNTSITKENFDPSNALAKSSSNFQQGLNTLQNSSINQNRSFLNRMYASKLDQDSDILTKYNQMNQSARSQYEARTADQRRYNITQTVGTNDINARNRAAYKEAVDVALNSVGNLGKGLNEKRTAYDSLAVLQKMYPDVYARIMAEQQKTQKSNGG